MRYDGCGTRSGEGGTRYERNGYEETSKDVIFLAGGGERGTRYERNGYEETSKDVFFLAGGGSRDWDEGRRAGAGRRRRSENFSLREAWRKVDDGEKFSLWGRGREWAKVDESGRKRTKVDESGREWTRVDDGEKFSREQWTGVEGSRRNAVWAVEGSRRDGARRRASRGRL